MFEACLARIVSQVGARGAAVLSVDGLTIEAVDAQGRSVTSDEAERDYASVIKQLSGVGEAMEIGALTEFTVEGQDHTTLVRLLAPGYFAALHLGPEVPPGKGRFYLRVAAPTLAREL